MEDEKGGRRRNLERGKSVDEATEEKFLLLGGPMGVSAIGRLPCFPEAFKSYAVQRI